LTLPSDPSCVVRAIKTLSFPPNKIGEVTDEDFELLRVHGHIGEGRLQLAEDFLSNGEEMGRTRPLPENNRSA